ncbi:MAG: UDP-3-O-(3-hydroxymyristoyl)glucosamine N-acyltransferase [Aquificae bacterium]|nr:UDP-3-O-(3-hydroxymyristoyl)glucosamine N-acyltransferase [Aquificota bacterium]
MKISQIAKTFNAKVINLKRDTKIKGLKSIHTAQKGDITFLTDKNLSHLAQKTKASAIFVKEPIENLNIPQIIVENPQHTFYKLIDIFYPDKPKKARKAKTAKISKNTKIGKNVYIGDYTIIEKNVEIGNNVTIYPHTYIGENTKIGDDVILYPRVTIYKDTYIGNRVIIHSGAVIGADGFGYYRENNQHQKIKHIGKVIIEDDVEIGANTTIDRAMLDETIIKKGAKIDNLVMIAHNCIVGERTIFAGQVGLAGSTEVGDDVILAGQVGVADHIKIGNNVIVTGKSGVWSNLEAGKMYGSNIPAMEWSKWKRVLAVLLKLPDIYKKIKKNL